MTVDGISSNHWQRIAAIRQDSNSQLGYAPNRFQQFLDQARAQGSNDEDQSPQQTALADAAKQMEIQLVTLMFRSMEQSGEGGLLGKSSEGLSHFKDMFFEQVAQEVVEQQGLGFAESILNTYKSSELGL